MYLTEQMLLGKYSCLQYKSVMILVLLSRPLKILCQTWSELESSGVHLMDLCPSTLLQNEMEGYIVFSTQER